jgi:hypothetical protein
MHRTASHVTEGCPWLFPVPQVPQFGSAVDEPLVGSARLPRRLGRCAVDLRVRAEVVQWAGDDGDQRRPHLGARRGGTSEVVPLGRGREADEQPDDNNDRDDARTGPSTLYACACPPPGLGAPPCGCLSGARQPAAETRPGSDLAAVVVRLDVGVDVGADAG